MGDDVTAYNRADTALSELDRHLFLEEIRATIRHNMMERGWSYQRTASEIGVSTHKLRELLDGRCYILAEDLAPFETWCEGAATAKVYPEQAALSLLFQDFGARLRAEARQRFVWRLRAAYVRLRMPVPMWMYSELRNWRDVRPRSFFGRKRR